MRRARSGRSLLVVVARRRRRSTWSRRARRGSSGSATRSTTRRSCASAPARERTRPGAARGGDLPGVEVPAERALVVGRDRADAAHAVDRARGSRSARAARRSTSATSPTRRSTSATAPGTSHDLFDEVRLDAARARRLQRRPGQRRPLARGRRGDPVPGDARLRRAGRAPRDASTASAWHSQLYPATDEPFDPIARARREREHLHAARAGRRADRDGPLRPLDGARRRARLERRAALPARGGRGGRGACARSTRACARTGRTACTWEVGTSRDAADLVERLLALGLVDDERRRSRSGWCSPSRRRSAARTSRCGARERRRRAARRGEIAAVAFGGRAGRAEAVDARATTTTSSISRSSTASRSAARPASFCEHGVSLFGGATLPEARGRGAYRALVAARWEDAVRARHAGRCHAGEPDVAADPGAARLPRGLRDPDPARRVRPSTAQNDRCASRRRRTTRSGRWSSWPRPATGPVKAERIAQAQEIPVNFLENILSDLRNAGLVAQPARGGGRLLARAAGRRDHARAE